VDECISEYTELIKAIFGERSSRLSFSWKGKVKAQFDSTRLEDSIKVITNHGVLAAELFIDGTERGCKV